MERWTGKTAVVTGASAGIGAAVCVALANAGLQVVGLARRQERVDELKSQVTGKGSIVSRKCDVSNTKDIAGTFQWIDENLGGIDLLVNNAGVFKQGNITDLGGRAITAEDVVATLDTNVKGMVLCTQLAVASMKRRKFEGHIVNVNSIAGHYIPFSSEFNIYGSTKHAVTAFSAALANELADYNSGIKVTSLSPGLVSTEMTVGASEAVPFTPLQPKDIADAVLYVVSTPAHVNITEITVQPVAEKRL